jgi:hypothetical protein
VQILNRPGIEEDPLFERIAMKKQTRNSPEVIERAVRMVNEASSEYESQWAAIESISAKIGCTAETLRR